MIKSIFSKRMLLIIVAFLTLGTIEAQIVVTGKVTESETGETLPGVNIIVVGTLNGTVTDTDGNFNLTVNKENPSLRFSYLGYTSIDVPVGDQRILSVSLEQDLAELDEVVVVGYGTTRRRDIISAQTSVKGEELAQGNPTSIQDALAGKAAGVQISQGAGGPGGGFNVLIRGGSSITAGNDPLYVLDGIPILINNSDPSSNPLADISPNNIESIEILKDASATAIYGAKGANGVIIINTKKGSLEPKFSLNHSTSYSKMTNVPQVLQPDEYAEFMMNKYFNDLITQGPTVRGSYEYWKNVIDSSKVGTIWIDEITQPSFSNNTNFSFSGGGTNNSKYSLSAGYLNDQGILIGSHFKRINIDASIAQGFKRGTIGATLRVSDSDKKGFYEQRDGSIPFYQSGGEANVVKRALQTNPFLPRDFNLAELDEGDGTSSWNGDNLITYINEVEIFSTGRRILANVYLNYELVNNLKFYSSYGMNALNTNNGQYFPSTVQAGRSKNGTSSQWGSNYIGWVYLASLNYSNDFGEHHFDALAAFEALGNENKFMSVRVDQFSNEILGNNSWNSAVGTYTPNKATSSDGMLSYFGRLQYSYQNKYLFTTTFRADGSSKFGKSNKWGYFPSVALGWIVSDEDFMNAIPSINNLKIRASYGITGNSQIPAYFSLARISGGNFWENYVFDGNKAIGYRIIGLANPELKWEKTAQYNVGFDLSMFKNRIQLVGEYYYKLTSDLLLSKPMPLYSGLPEAVVNSGSISNEGIEFTLTTFNVSKSNFSWNTSLTFTRNNTIILELGGIDNEEFYTSLMNYQVKNDIVLREGESIGTFYGYVQDGLYNNSVEAANSSDPDIYTPNPGYGKVLDVNQDGRITTADRVIIGNTTPEFTGGISNSVRYKNLDLTVYFRYSYGNDIINGNIAYIDRAGMHNWNTLKPIANNVWFPNNPQGNTTGTIPEGTWGTIMRSDYVEDGSYLNCEYINLGYSLSNGISNYIDKLRLYVGVRNPFIFTRYSWFNPDVNTRNASLNIARIGPGIDVGTYPRTLTYTAGITLDF
ncbi:MAG: TonB-dependent receptor [Bacteroidales bacterium]